MARRPGLEPPPPPGFKAAVAEYKAATKSLHMARVRYDAANGALRDLFKRNPGARDKFERVVIDAIKASPRAYVDTLKRVKGDGPA